ncbi:hypothetical protein E4U17_001020 [Claviceps sp. LM77 group G4]|nr:hypothetical protein E4U17_001020 [Claviceps sp. LM77 group G4]
MAVMTDNNVVQLVVERLVVESRVHRRYRPREVRAREGSAAADVDSGSADTVYPIPYDPRRSLLHGTFEVKARCSAENNKADRALTKLFAEEVWRFSDEDHSGVYCLMKKTQRPADFIEKDTQTPY